MTPLTFRKAALLLAVLGISGVVCADIAQADKGRGRGHGSDDYYEDSDHHSSGHHSSGDHSDDDSLIDIIIGDDDREVIRHYIKEDHHRHCPPGLVKKNNGCLPPGQAKKYVIGQRLPDDVIFVPVSDDLRRLLKSAPAGYQYVQVDKDILLIGEATKKVIDAVTLMSAVGN